MNLRPSQKPRPWMRGIYFIRNPALNLLIRVVDRVLAWTTPSHRRISTVPIKRILVTNLAHLGDVVLATSVLPTLLRAFPQAQFGFVVASWSRPIVADHEGVTWIHTIDHWWHNRAPISTWQKFQRYVATRSQAMREIRRIGYDCAIDLYFYFPNSVLFLWQTGIPIRVGYTSAGLGPLLTHSLDMRPGDRQMTEYHDDLAKLICPPELNNSKVRSPLLPSLQFASGRVLPATIRDVDYLVLHMGSGSALKQWPIESWRSLADCLHDAGHRLVFTGTSEEADAATAVMKGITEVVNLCGELDLASFSNVLKNARMVIAIDSVAGHLAGAMNTPCIVIGHGMNNLSLWHPPGSSSIVIRHPTPCSPCYRNAGCETMDCIRLVAFQDIASQVANLVGSPAKGVEVENISRHGHISS